MASLFNNFDQIYVINLASRSDRRTEMNAQLRRAGLSLDHEQITLFEAVRPDDPGEFETIGGKGCFMSHLGVLKDAKAKGYKTIFIFEDDADFTRAFFELEPELDQYVANERWGFFYFGYYLKEGLTLSGDGPIATVPPEYGLILAHALAIDSACINLLVPYLEAMAARPGGHPDGGPMLPDGAYSWFRNDHPEFVTLATRQQLIVQRPSATDIHQPTWREHIPLVGLLRRAKSKLLRMKR